MRILEKSFDLSPRAAKFLDDIKTKRKLTEAQAKWFRDLAQQAGVAIEGEVQIKTAVTRRHVTCDHEDLGSLGYTHGETVKCPHCGQLAEVW